jgi:hypothetical protein
VSISTSPHSGTHAGQQQLADYATIFDMLGLLTGITSESTATSKIMEIFTMFFAPRSLIYLAMKDGKTLNIKSDPSTFKIADDLKKRLQTFPDSTGWTDWEQGFAVAIQHSGYTLGVVAVDGLTFAERKRHYLNLATAIAPVLALVISNARNFQEKEELIGELQEALAKVKTLRGLLPICANCKKIRDDRGYWNRIEAYIGQHTDAQFSHGICPDCAKKLYPELFEEKGAEDIL